MAINTVKVGKRVYILEGFTVYHGKVVSIDVYDAGCKYGFTATVVTADGNRVKANSNQLSASYPALANYWKNGD